MKIWDDVFKTWKDTCPYIKRELLTKDQFVRWALDLRLINTMVKDHFYIYLNFLEECEILCPLTLNIVDTKDPYYALYLFHYTSSEHLYHPMQFFEVVNWYNHTNLKRPPYFFSREFREYFSFKKLQYDIERQKKEIEFFKSKGWSCDNLQKHLVSLEEELKEKEKDYPIGINLLRQLNIGFTSRLFPETSLRLWIKLESLCIWDDAHISAPRSPEMILMIKDYNNINESRKCIEDYRNWANYILNNKENYLNNEEIDVLKNFHHYLGHKIGGGDFGPFGTKGNWNDLLDILPPEKKDKLGGLTSYYINLLFIRRYLERAYWLLLNKNIQYRQESNEKPYFYTDSYEEEMQYRKSVFLQFELFLSNPFILYVEGETERTLLIEYLKKKYGIRFKIKNMVGIDKSSYHKRICEDIEDRDFYFFFDFDTLEKYNANKEKYGLNCTFFFPDFITENFSVNQFYDTFISWIENINLNLEEDQKLEIYKSLKKEKEYSNEIIKELESGLEIKKRNTKGFEKIIIKYLQYNFPKEIQKIYPENISLDRNGWILNLKDFEDLVKNKITERLKQIIINSMKIDPKRKNRFPFEVKLEPFMKKLMEIYYNNPHWL